MFCCFGWPTCLPGAEEAAVDALSVIANQLIREDREPTVKGRQNGYIKGILWSRTLDESQGGSGNCGWQKDVEWVFWVSRRVSVVKRGTGPARDGVEEGE